MTVLVASATFVRNRQLKMATVVVLNKSKTQPPVMNRFALSQTFGHYQSLIDNQ